MKNINLSSLSSFYLSLVGVVFAIVAIVKDSTPGWLVLLPAALGVWAIVTMRENRTAEGALGNINLWSLSALYLSIIGVALVIAGSATEHHIPMWVNLVAMIPGLTAILRLRRDH